MKKLTSENQFINLQLRKSTFRKIRKFPKLRLPENIALQYSRKLKSFIDRQETLIKNNLIKNLPSVIQEAEKVIPAYKQDDYIDTVNNLTLNISLESEMNLEELDQISRETAKDIQKFHKKQFDKGFKKSVGTEVLTDDNFLEVAEKSFVTESKEYMEKLTKDINVDVKNQVLTGIKNGEGVKEIQKRLLKGDLKGKGKKGVIRKAKKRAELIAVDQSLTYYAKVNQYRQQSIGLTKYKWRNSQDLRVRGRPDGKFPNSRFDHWKREGKVYKWKKPPKDGNPGEPIRCRCYGEPYIKEIVKEVEG